MRDYVARLSAELPGSRLLVMQSSGGLVLADRFRGRDAVLSGPAGGAVATARVAEAAGVQAALGFDMGGTSTDVCRVEGLPERIYEAEVAGVRLRSPMIDIHTVAAGGGSLCRRAGQRLTVGPESAGAEPGPLCYGHPDATEIALTDVNLALGRLRSERFPFPLDRDRSTEALTRLSQQVPDLDGMEAVAEGFLEVAHEAMAGAIRKVSVARGHDVRRHALVVFGGAGGQHAAALARRLDIDVVLFPPFAGVLSAYGMALADVEHHGVRDAGPCSLAEVAALEVPLAELTKEGAASLEAQGFSADRQTHLRRLDLRYQGTETVLTLAAPALDERALRRAFEDRHRRTFGYVRPDAAIEVVAARLESRGRAPSPDLVEPPRAGAPEPFEAEVFIDGAWRSVPALPREALGEGRRLEGPALVLEATGTIVVEAGFVLEGGATLRMRRTSEEAPGGREGTRRDRSPATPDPVRLEVYNHRFMALAEQMGEVLRRTASSVNIRERLDFSCALFDGEGALIANAPHIPVHLGAMSESVKAILRQHPDMKPGDVFVTNDPAAGGSHLPDITVVTPVFDGDGARRFFTASRGHHEDVGGITPGSMPPFSRSLSEEGVVLRGLRLVREGTLDLEGVRSALCSGPHPARRPDGNLADLEAQMAANETGARLLRALVDREGRAEVEAYMGFVREDAARRVRAAIQRLDPEARRFEDALDDGTPIVVAVETTDDGGLIIDFDGTGPASEGNLNAPRAVTVAAALYVMRSLVGAPIPLNSGCLAPIELRIPSGSLLDPPEEAAVAGGNVETSQRVVDVLLGALGQAAASQGTMNNLTFGDDRFGYYETIAGGAGATPRGPGRSGVHTHMTNTRITDPEVLEARFPVRLVRFGLRAGSGGRGRHRGGDGIIRELEALRPLRVSILSERRTRSPFGLEGGGPGAAGRNLVDGRDVGGKVQTQVEAGGRIRIETPGGGGYGAP